jgi:hypothetical protein
MRAHRLCNRWRRYWHAPQSWNALDPEGETWLHPLNALVSAMGHYAVFVDGQFATRGRALQMASGCSYVSMVYTAPVYRR